MGRDSGDFLGRGWAFPVGQVKHNDGSVDIRNVSAETDIQQSIRIIIGTAPGERVMRPEFGCGIHALTFAVIDMSTLNRIEAAVRDALTRYEARIELNNVRVSAGDSINGVLDIEIDYRVRKTNQSGNFVYPFYFREGGAA
ncbi:MAG TPA: baseplate protein [Alphaproteobacteria bacterium]|nr:baseplate protein [Alphaproteobacteria bacterium]